MNISGISSSSSQASIIAQMSERMMKKSDTNQDGSISRSELATSLEDAPQAKDGSAAPDAEALFTKIDSDGDGSITQSELEADMESQGAQMSSGAAPSGTPPAQGGGGAPASSSSSTDSSKVYEAADTDKDGTVSVQEQMAYDLKHPEQAKQAAIDQKRNEPAPYARIGQSIDVTV